MEAAFLKKSGIIVILVVLFILPLSSITSLIRERKHTSTQAYVEVGQTWGGEQAIIGPVLSIPFKNYKGTYLFYLPDKLDIEADLDPEKLHRGIYELIVYRSKLNLEGHFSKPDFSSLGVNENELLLNKAILSLGISNLNGIGNQFKIKWDHHELNVQPGQPKGALVNGLHAQVPFVFGALASAGKKETDTPDPERGAQSKFDFSIELSLNGSSDMRFAPIGKENQVKMTSAWKHPSFQGHYLPNQRTIDANGFTAEWGVSYFGRKYPQYWTATEASLAASLSPVKASLFGVKLIQPIDFYKKSERSTKYGIIVIILTFLSFLLFEALNRLRIHPMQYLMVGFSLCIFYLLLISLSEHTGFLMSYIIASNANIILISTYAASFLLKRTRGVAIAGILAVLYGAFYIILQNEGFALVIGSSGLFFLLTIIMLLTRKLDWYSVFDAFGEKSCVRNPNHI